LKLKYNKTAVKLCFQFHLAPLQLEPCFQATVDVSNDNGTLWSPLSTDTFLYCPVYVSTYGSNSYGDGTPRLPYRDISRAIQGKAVQVDPINTRVESAAPMVWIQRLQL
jgi:hypothetical protein